MGIYTNGDVFGIRIYTRNDDIDSYNNTNTLFKREYKTIMTNEQIKEAYSFYQGLNSKENIRFEIYTEFSTTHDKDESIFMMWHQMSLNLFLEKFGI